MARCWSLSTLVNSKIILLLLISEVTVIRDKDHIELFEMFKNLCWKRLTALMRNDMF